MTVTCARCADRIIAVSVGEHACKCGFTYVRIHEDNTFTTGGPSGYVVDATDHLIPAGMTCPACGATGRKPHEIDCDMEY
jgi:hypothetical protein